jgi:hypothetical protein
MKRFFYTLILLLSFSLTSCNSYSKEQLEQDVKASIIAENDDPSIIVNEVNLIKTMENTYEGFVNTSEQEGEFQYSITVFVDGDEFLWEIY